MSKRIRLQLTLFLLLVTIAVAGNKFPEKAFDGKDNQQVTLRAVVKIEQYSDGIGNYLISGFCSDNPKQLLFALRMNNKKLELVAVESSEGGKYSYRSVSSKSDVKVGEKVYLCGVKNDDQLLVYINGKCEGKRIITTQTPAANMIATATECRTGNKARDLVGRMANVKVFESSLSSREVARDYSVLFNQKLNLYKKDDGIYMPVSVPAKPKEFPNAPAMLDLDLGFIEAFLPDGEFIDATNVSFVRWDAQKNEPVRSNLQWREEYDLYEKKMTIVWKRPENSSADFAVCFNGQSDACQQTDVIPMITGGEPLSVGRKDLTSQGQGLAGYPVILDYDGDGLDDLLVSYVIPRRIMFYKNIGTKTNPVYDAPQMAFEGKSLLNFDMFQLDDGEIYAYSYKKDKLNFWKAKDSVSGKTIDFQNSFNIEGLPEGYEIFDISFADANNDGIRDLVIGGFEGTWWWDGGNPWNAGKGSPNIGYGRGYDDENKWYGKPPVGSVYVVINNGSDVEAQFAAAEVLSVDGEAIKIPTTQMSVAIGDINGDNKQDLLLGCGVDETLIYYNTSDDSSKFKLDMPVNAYRDSIVSKYSYFDQRFEIVDYDNDGDIEVVVCSNPGIVVICEISEDGLLVEEQIIGYKGADLWAESLVVPSIVDMNDDGVWDVVTGDASGFLSYFENTGSTAQPIFPAREKLKSQGQIIRPIAGYSGSIQGPNEARWGYLAPNVCDYDGDGKLDVVISDITGYNYWMKNISSKKGGCEFSLPEMLKVETWPLKVRWRNRPAMWYYGEEKMPSAIITSDQDGYMSLYERDFIKGPSALKKGRRLKLATGTDIKIDGPSGYNGRNKFCTYDYNNDGVNDLLIGQPRRGFINSGRRFDLSHEGYAYVALLINVGSNREPVFAESKALTLANGKVLYYGTHSCSPDVMDVDGDGREEIFIGTERGYVRCYNRSLFEDSSQIISIPQR